MSVKAKVAQYTLIITVPDEEDRKILHGGEYKLCISKQVGETHNVVWSANEKFKASNEYSWTEEYEVFAVEEFEDGVLVQTTSDVERIKFGQTCTLDEDSEMSKAAGPEDKSGKFYVQNEYGATCFGVNGKIDGKFSAIFVSKPTVPGKVTFEPRVIVGMWFATKQSTGTMFFEAETTLFQVEYTGETREITVAYKGGKWSEL